MKQTSHNELPTNSIIMETVELWKLAESEFEMEEGNPFCLQGVDNAICLTGSALNVYKFEPMSCAGLWHSIFPYEATLIPIPKRRSFKKLLEDIDFTVIYGAGNIQESQELAMDPLYVSDCSIDPPKSRNLHAEFVPHYPQQTAELCTILTNYGELDMLYRTPIIGNWESLKTNLSTILIPETFFEINSTNKIERFTQLRDYAQIYQISYFCWDKTKPILYLSTAAGYIIRLNYDIEQKEFKKLDSLSAEIGEIVYLMNFENFLFVSSRQGCIHLYQIDSMENALKHCECLYNNPDGMTCKRAIMQYNTEHNVYILLFAKSAHLMAYCLSKEGKILSNAVQYVSGIKITGIETVGANEFFVTTIVSQIKLIRISYVPNNDNSLKIDEYTIKHNLDMENFQILDICSTGKRRLWSVVLYRNKSIHHFSKCRNNMAILAVCRLSNLNTIMELEKHFQSGSIDGLDDLMIIICLDIINRINLKEYKEFCNLTKIQYPNSLTMDFLNQMRIKYFLEYQINKPDRFEYPEKELNADITIRFLKSTIQMMHIIQRLKYLQTLDTQLTGFQQLAISCMQSKYFDLIFNLKNLLEKDTHLNDTIKEFLKFMENMDMYHFLLDNMELDLDHCLICSEPLTVNDFATCKKGHTIRRCTISYVQLPFCDWRYCPQCNALSLPSTNAQTKPTADVESLASDSLAVSSHSLKSSYRLEELFPSNEQIRCTFCNFLLKQACNND